MNEVNHCGVSGDTQETTGESDSKSSLYFARLLEYTLVHVVSRITENNKKTNI